MTRPTATGHRDEVDLLIDLRDRVLDAPAPAPGDELATLFDGGVVDLTDRTAPDPWRPRRRRPVVLAGLATGVVLAGTGVAGAAGALPGPTQAAFDRTVGVVGIDLGRVPAGGADPIAVVDAGADADADLDPAGDDRGGPGEPATGPGADGPRAPGSSAEHPVAADATDPTSPGVDDPAGLADGRRDRPAAPDRGTGPVPALPIPPAGDAPGHAPHGSSGDPAAPAHRSPAAGPPVQERGGPAEGDAPAPADQTAPERSDAGHPRGPAPSVGRP